MSSVSFNTSSATAPITTSAGAGFNVQQMVQAALAADSGPLYQMQQEQTTLQGQTAALNQLQTELTALQTAVQALSDPTGAIYAETTTSSDPSILTATAANGATTGNHTIVVNSLATTSSAYSSEFASSSTALPTGSFDIQVGTGATTTITVDSTNNTLSGIASTINGQNLGVTASVITDANGARLSLVSNTSGAAGNITISNDTVGLGFTQNAGTNASLTVDGVPISSGSNMVSGVISGVTLNLLSASPGTSVSLSVAPDNSQITSAINNFVSAYNTLISDVNSQFNVDPTTQQAGVLASDSTVGMLQEQLLSMVNFSTTGNNGMVNLAALGINMQNDGTLTVDTSTLNQNLSTNMAAVQNFFQNTSNTGFAQTLNTTLTQMADPVTGILGTDINGIAQTQTDLASQISDFQAYLNSEQQSLTQQYSQVDTVLQQLPLLQAQIAQQLAGA
jgi:flagellar hook-associated protein 2